MMVITMAKIMVMVLMILDNDDDGVNDIGYDDDLMVITLY